MELTLIEGPLDEARLAAIAGLYGAYNHKYRDAGFCRRMFNENPNGGTLHALLTDERGTILGHHAILPIGIVREGELRRSGKAEAFVVHVDHRRATVPVDGKQVIAGLAMPLALYRFGLERGLDPIHMVAPRDVGTIHRMAGCRALDSRELRAVLTLRPNSEAFQGPAWKRALFAAAVTGQGIASRIAQAVSLAGSGSVRVWSGADLTSGRLARIVEDLPIADGWTLALDLPTLAWMARVGDLLVFSLDEAMSAYAVACPRAGEGRTMEIVFWRQPEGGDRGALRLLGAIVQRARLLDDGLVAYSQGVARHAGELAHLGAAGRWLWFNQRPQSTNSYVRSEDRYYLDARNLRFTPFFHAIF